MTGRSSLPAHRPGEFAHARAQAELDSRALRTRAARTVAGQAVNDDDRTRLLSMLGLEDPTVRQSDPVDLSGLERGLAGYVAAVAAILEVPADATAFEISDTITIYVGLSRRAPDAPGRDLMLLWNDHDGWLVAVETAPTERQEVLGYLGGGDILPRPFTVARFVVTLLAGTHPRVPRPTFPTLTIQELAERLRPHWRH